MPPIVTDKNTLYGPPLVTQKYAPLSNINFAPADQPIYSGLLSKRSAALRSANRLGRPLTLAVPNWVNTVAGEAGHLPPLVVISSNRSKWIATAIAAGAARLSV